MPRHRSFFKPASPGFTLIELLVATAILMLLTVLLLNLTSHAASIWKQNQDRNSLRASARLALDFIGSELAQAALPLDPNDDAVCFVVNPTGIPEENLNRDAIFWRAPVATDDRYGELAGVGYFVRKTNSVYTLCRVLLNPGDPLLEADPALWPTAAPAVFDSDPTLTYQGLFLENVPGLWVTAYADDGTTYVPDSRLDGQHHLPAMLDVSLAFLDKTGVARLEAGDVELPDPSLAANADAYIQGLPPPLQSHVGAARISIVFKDRKGGSP